MYDPGLVMTHYRIRYGIFLLALNLIIMQHASAEDKVQAPYMEGSLGFFTTQGEPSDAQYDSSSVSTTAFIYRLGLPILNYYAVGFVLGTGITKDDSPIGEVGINSILGADFKASYPFGKGFEGFVRGGLARMAIDLTDTTIPDANNKRDVYNGFGVTVGIGGVYDMGKYGRIFLEYQRMPNVDLEIDWTNVDDTNPAAPVTTTGTVNIDTQTSGVALGYQFFIRN